MSPGRFLTATVCFARYAVTIADVILRMFLFLSFILACRFIADESAFLRKIGLFCLMSGMFLTPSCKQPQTQGVKTDESLRILMVVDARVGFFEGDMLL